MIIVLCSRCERRAYDAGSSHLHSSSRIHSVSAVFTLPDGTKPLEKYGSSRMTLTHLHDEAQRQIEHGHEAFVFCPECEAEWRRAERAIEADRAGLMEQAWGDFMKGGKQ